MRRYPFENLQTDELEAEIERLEIKLMHGDDSIYALQSTANLLEAAQIELDSRKE